MELVEEVKELLIETERELKGSTRRLFMARTVRHWEKEVSAWQNGSWDGIVEPSVRACMNSSMGSSVSMRSHREAASAVKSISPTYFEDIIAIVDGQSQADPKFRTNVCTPA